MLDIPRDDTPPSGARLRFLRRSLDVKQSALAQELGVSQAAVSRWETGSRPVPQEVYNHLERLSIDGNWSTGDKRIFELVSSSGNSVHLVTDVGHRLLAASSKRTIEWRNQERHLFGKSLWKFAPPGVRSAEANLVHSDWWSNPHPSSILVSFDAYNAGLNIVKGNMRWTRIWLSQGFPARLCENL